MSSVCKKLLNNFNFIPLRSFNQDPIENFFGNIRSHGIRNTNPLCSQFKTSLKALTINNFSSARSVGYNCEEDFSEGVLNNLSSFLVNSDLGVRSLDNTDDEPIPFPIVFNYNVLNNKPRQFTRNVRAYIAGFLIRKILKTSKDCPTCKDIFLSNPDKDIDLISARDFAKCLIRPNSYVNLLLNQSLTILYYLMPKICHYKNLSKILGVYIKAYLDVKPINCSEHSTGELFTKLVVKFFIYNWIKSIKKILKGVDRRLLKNIKNDNIKILAYKKYLKRRRRR